jgi:hypothetical protein
MAGGIDWFRWHHGTVSDMKFPLVAKRAGASVAEVIAVWAFILESASMSEGERGVLSSPPDFEALDCAMGMQEGRAESIWHAMQARNLIDTLQVVAWPKRQPKRERDGDSSTDRVQAFRNRKRHETPSNANDGSKTPNESSAGQGTPRGEERREEPPTETSFPPVGAAKSPRATRKCPEYFVVTTEMREWAAREVPGVNVDVETAKLRDHTFRTAISDWPGAWRNWMRRSHEDRPVRPTVNRQEALEARNRAVGEQWLKEQESHEAH